MAKGVVNIDELTKELLEPYRTAQKNVKTNNINRSLNLASGTNTSNLAAGAAGAAQGALGGLGGNNPNNTNSANMMHYIRGIALKIGTRRIMAAIIPVKAIHGLRE